MVSKFAPGLTVTDATAQATVHPQLHIDISTDLIAIEESGWLRNTRLAKTAAYTLDNADKGKTIALGGSAFYALTVGAASGFDDAFAVRIINEDTARAKTMTVNGLTSWLLFPGQSLVLFNQNDVWKTDRTQPQRWRLTGSVTVYVDLTNGADTNDGLASGSGNALQTIQAAANMVWKQFDLNAQAVTIQLAAGTYTTGVTFTGVPVGQGTVTLSGDTGTPSNVIISTTSAIGITAVSGAQVNVQGLKLQTTTSGSCILASGQGSYVGLTNAMEFGTAAAAHMYAFSGGRIVVSANYTINGNCATHWAADGIGSIVQCSSRTVTISGTPAWSSQFAQAFHLAAITAPGNTFSGSATGKRYTASLNGVIRVDGAASTYFPGDSAGSTATQGLYS